LGRIPLQKRGYEPRAGDQKNDPGGETVFDRKRDQKRACRRFMINTRKEVLAMAIATEIPVDEKIFESEVKNFDSEDKKVERSSSIYDAFGISVPI
jgi:hypothetical protein